MTWPGWQKAIGRMLFVCLQTFMQEKLFGQRQGIHLHVFDAVRVFRMLGWRQLCEAVFRRSNISWHIILGWKMISQLGSQWCRPHDTDAHTVCIPALSVWPHKHNNNMIVVHVVHLPFRRLFGAPKKHGNWMKQKESSHFRIRSPNFINYFISN